MKQMMLVRSSGFLFGILLGASAVAAEWTVGVEFPTIQATVNAASSGDTIYIPAGDYYEQIVIMSKNLTLAGEPGAVLHATTSMTRTLLACCGANTYPVLAMVNSQVVLTGLTFEGERLGNRYQNAFYGIVFRGSGGRVENCTVRGFRGSTTADSRAINVVNFVSLGTATIDLNVFNSTFADHERSIVLSGDVNNPRLLRTTFTIEGNGFTGLGPGSQIPQNGILILTGAGGQVKGNTMAGYSYSGGVNALSSAILAHDNLFASAGYFPLQPIRYERNTFSNSDHHLVTIVANGSQVVSNTFQGTAPGWRRWGSLVLSGTNVLVTDNQFSDLPIGIELFGGEANGTIIRGIASGTKLFNNRFCRVPEPLRSQPLATGTQESGTEIICPVPPPRDLHVPADYATIQQAVDAAAPGDTIHIASGDYFEQVIIANKGRLTLLGVPGAALHAKSGMAETLRPFLGQLWVPLLATYRTDVAISNLTFDGERLGETYNGVFRGVNLFGSSGRLENCAFRGFRGATLSTYTDANALYTDNSVGLGSPAVTLDVLNSGFSDNELSIHLRGDPVTNPSVLRTSFTLEGNTVTGLGPVPISVVGIYMRNGAAGVVRSNTISDYAYTGTGDLFSPGIVGHDGRATNRVPNRYVPLLPVRYEGNTFSNNDEHLVLIAANDSQIVNNIFHGRGPDQPRWGALALSGTNLLVANNDFSDLETAIHLFGNDPFFSGWPTIPIATAVNLSANWFCNVVQPVSIRPGATGVQEFGTQLCPARAVFQSIARDGTLQVRAWHGRPITIEASSDLRNWAPTYTNTPALPTFDYREATAPTGPHRFYRAVQY